MKTNPSHSFPLLDALAGRTQDQELRIQLPFWSQLVGF